MLANTKFSLMSRKLSYCEEIIIQKRNKITSVSSRQDLGIVTETLLHVSHSVINRKKLFQTVSNSTYRFSSDRLGVGYIRVWGSNVFKRSRRAHEAQSPLQNGNSAACWTERCPITCSKQWSSTMGLWPLGGSVEVLQGVPQNSWNFSSK